MKAIFICLSRCNLSSFVQAPRFPMWQAGKGNLNNQALGSPTLRKKPSCRIRFIRGTTQTCIGTDGRVLIVHFICYGAAVCAYLTADDLSRMQCQTLPLISLLDHYSPRHELVNNLHDKHVYRKKPQHVRFVLYLKNKIILLSKEILLVHQWCKRRDFHSGWK